MTHNIGKGIVWNYASLIILGVSGIGINFLIAHSFGASSLGVFNQIFAFYIVLSQFAVGGIHFSALKSVAEHYRNREKIESILSAGLILAGVLGLVVASILLLGKAVIGKLYSADVVRGIGWLAPALVVFALNKVMISVLNGLHWMRLFAVAQAGRYLNLLLIIFCVSYIWKRPDLLPLSFFGAEILVFVFLIVTLFTRFRLSFSQLVPWMEKHISFGMKGFLSGVLLELNTRVDVLILGIFTNDWVVGVYSFASTLAEGMYQLLVVVKNNINPILARLMAADQKSSVAALVRKVQSIVYPCAFSFLILLNVAVWLGGQWGIVPEDIAGGIYILVILTTGIALISGYIPFDAILLQSGYPGYHSILTALIVWLNITFNFLLIPLWSSVGAACATVLAYLCGIFALNIMVRYILSFRLRTG